MGSNIVSLFLTLQYFSSFVLSITPIDSLDVLIHDHALNALVNQRPPRTGALYNASLAGMKLSVVRLRSNTLWRKGANFTNFHIPPNTLPIPYVKRLLIVSHDLGNWSSHYFNLSGYSLLTSVVGFTIYDSSSNIKNLTRLGLDTTGQPISIEFKNVSAGKTKCVTFDGKGKVFLSGMGEFPNVCYTRNQGHFSVMVPDKRKMETWRFWLIGFGVGVFGLAVVGVVGNFLHGIVKSKKKCGMEKETEDGEFMESVWIYNNSKMPRAVVTRTHPVIDNSCLH